MKYSKSDVHSKVRAVPELKFETQTLTSFAGLVIVQKFFATIELKKRLWKCFAHLNKRKIFNRTTLFMQLKQIGQMQPYYEAKGVGRVDLAGRSIPSWVSQISDSENGGVMMNEFPGKYREVISESSGARTPPVNGTEYLKYLDSLGLAQQDFPVIQPIMQQRIWDRSEDGAGPEAMEKVIKQLQEQDGRFHMEGGSWTYNISWVRGYEDVLKPMEAASAIFSEKVLSKNISTCEPRYRNALYHLLITQTSCYRYWGQGEWADRGRELCRRVMESLKRDF
jgi:hypothetical protein